jgi:hypothetical protein
MSYTFLVNQRPSTGGVAMYLILSNFIAAAWVVESSSDGTTYNSSGNQITGGGTGAHGLANNMAWFRIRDPGGVREFIVQRGTTNLQWAIKYSPAARFTGGAPTATQVPTATDEVAIWGNITGATQTYAGLFTSDGTYNLHMGMGDASVHYAFWAQALILGTTSGSAFGSWCMDYVLNSDVGDLDPTVHFAGANAHDFQTVGLGLNANCFFTSIVSANFLPVQLGPYKPSYFGTTAGQIMANNEWNGYFDVLPGMWWSPTYGYKGYSTLFTPTSNTLMYTGDTASVGNPPVAGTKDHMAQGEWNNCLLVPWPAGVDAAN